MLVVEKVRALAGGEQTSVDGVRQIVLLNAQAAALKDVRVHVAADPHGGFWVRVVHDSLVGLAEAERRRILLAGLPDLISTAELVTSDEEAWYGPPFRDNGDSVPAWPEMLSLPNRETPVVFPSDLDSELVSPTVVTFYSLRGGVGRSTALVAAGQILASRGRRVLCIDMDFEAPGLDSLMGFPQAGDNQGALPILLALERNEAVDIRDHVQRSPDAAELYCLPAGRLDATYARRLRLLDPEIWYREEHNPLRLLIDAAAQSSIAPDLILIDSRTGISPISAPLLFDISDLAVICFYPHPQTRTGTELLVRSLMNAVSRRSTAETRLTPEPRFLVAPVPPGPSAAQVRSRASEWIDGWLAQVNESRPADLGALAADELMHAISYSAEIAFRDQVSGLDSAADIFNPVADWLEQLLPAPSTKVSRKELPNKGTILEELDFSTGAAEFQQNFTDDFVQTRVVKQAAESRFPLVIGRKGTGKTALFRWLIERPETRREPIVVNTPAPLGAHAPWAISPHGFSAVEQALKSDPWSMFWSCYTALATYLSLSVEQRVGPPEQLGLDLSKLAGSYNELAVINSVRIMFASKDAGLLAARWLHELDQAGPGERFLLYDGLDTGFGNDREGRNRRTRAVAGLLTFLTETESRLTNLKFKVMLRFDIWQQLRFENKSHLFGRSIQLTWRDKTDYFKTALKQAMRSHAFRGYVSGMDLSEDVDDWTTDEVRQTWNVLVGERMKGGKTTFTRNWAWNRLADGHGDHGPRALSQLFHEAVQWERAEEMRKSYDESVLRPRALVPSLDIVSIAAVAALMEEFPELEPLIGTLRELGRTPLAAADVRSASLDAADQLELALEAGLLSAYEGAPGEVRRYRVPDLIGWASE